MLASILVIDNDKGEVKKNRKFANGSYNLTSNDSVTKILIGKIKRKFLGNFFLNKVSEFPRYLEKEKNFSQEKLCLICGTKLLQK